MVIVLPPKVKDTLTARAKQRGLTPEELATEVLEQRFAPTPLPEPRDEWERQLFSIGIDAGVSLSDQDLSREAIYD